MKTFLAIIAVIIVGLVVVTLSNPAAPIPTRCDYDVNSTTPTVNVCAYDQTDRLDTNTAVAVLGPLFVKMGCYCRTDCYPHQITCNRNTLPEYAIILAYYAELFYYHCYCPTNPPQENPCPQYNPFRGQMCRGFETTASP